MIIKQTESTYTPVPAGAHVARCYGLVDLGTQPSTNPQFKPQRKGLLLFEIPGETITNGTETRPMGISQFLNAYLGSSRKPSKTALFLTAWRGKAFTEQELQGFDLANVVGAPCLLNIVHEEKDGKVREVIASISPLPKGMVCPVMVNKAVKYEISQGKNETYNNLAPWQQTMISKCLEWTTPQGEDADSDIDAAAAEIDNKDSQMPF